MHKHDFIRKDESTIRCRECGFEWWADAREPAYRKLSNGMLKEDHTGQMVEPQRDLQTDPEVPDWATTVGQRGSVL